MKSTERNGREEVTNKGGVDKEEKVKKRKRRRSK